MDEIKHPALIAAIALGVPGIAVLSLRAKIATLGGRCRSVP